MAAEIVDIRKSLLIVMYTLVAVSMTSLSTRAAAHPTVLPAPLAASASSNDQPSVAAPLLAAAELPIPNIGPRVPVGPLTSIRCNGSFVSIKASDNVAAIIASHPWRTTYCFEPGIYSRLQIVPRDGDRYIGRKGAVLDGQNAVSHAFTGAAENVSIRNFIIRNYAAPLQDAPISNCTRPGNGWTIENNEIFGNAGAGIHVCGSGTRVVANYLHDNRQEGYSCTGANGVGGDWIVITDNEIAHNNPDGAIDPGFEAGAGKCSFTRNLTLSYNFSHDNHGPGLWVDIDNQAVDIENNRVENNWSGGIFYEISWDGVIAHNYVRHNANPLYCKDWLWCGEIQIAASGGVNFKILEIYDNTVMSAAPGNGVVLIQQDRGLGLHGLRLVQNVHVHDNRIDLSAGGATGAVTDTGGKGIFSALGNAFERNTYSGYGGNSFWWNDKTGNLVWFEDVSRGTRAETR